MTSNAMTPRPPTLALAHVFLLRRGPRSAQWAGGRAPRRGCEDEGATVETPIKEHVRCPAGPSTTPSGRRLTGGRCPLHARSSGAQQKRARLQDRVQAKSHIPRSRRRKSSQSARRAEGQKASAGGSPSISLNPIGINSTLIPTSAATHQAQRGTGASTGLGDAGSISFTNACELNPCLVGLAITKQLYHLQVGRITPPWLSGITLIGNEEVAGSILAGGSSS